MERFEKCVSSVSDKTHIKLIKRKQWKFNSINAFNHLKASNILD